MIQKKYNFHTPDELKDIVARITEDENYRSASGILMQLYNPKVGSDEEAIVDYINRNCKKACLVGITCANIADSEFDISDRPMELNVTIFQKTRLIPFYFDLEETTGFVAGRILNEELQKIPDAKAMIVCYSCGSSAIHTFTREFRHHNLPLFGTKAGRSIRALNTANVYGKRVGANGIAAVIFMGDDLRLYMDNCLGFKEIGVPMKVTKTDGDNVIAEIDHRPATEVYSKYLKVRPGPYFVQNVCEFPMIFHRDGCVIARVPAAYGADNSIVFTSDVTKGETFRLAYGKAENLLEIIEKSAVDLKNYHPEAVFLFECGNRVRFLKENAAKETERYREAYPELSVGIGYAELFYSDSGHGGALNSALIAVGLTEDPSARNEIHGCVNEIEDADQKDEREYIPFIDRILNFLERTSIELDAVNRELGRIAYTDQLTKVYNRWELEHKINEIVDQCRDDGTPASLIFMDIDHFKKVNDTFGHDAGDLVLRATVELIMDNLKSQHVFGRWGGEEFIYVLPGVELAEAAKFAEGLRKQIEEICYVTVKHVTMSFGVTQYQARDDLLSFVKRADQALYKAKEGGRNRVVCLPEE